VPTHSCAGGYWPSINPPFPSSESKMTGQGSGGGLDQHMASGSQPNSPPPPAPPHPGPNSVRAARVDRSEVMGGGAAGARDTAVQITCMHTHACTC